MLPTNSELGISLREVMVKTTYLGFVEEGEQVLSADAAGNPVRKGHTIGLDVHRCVHGVWLVDRQVVGALALIPVCDLATLALAHGDVGW